MNQFNELDETKIGNIAEGYVDDYLISKGYKTWMNTNKQSTPFDGFANNNKAKEGFKRILIEIKCKTKNKYGNISIHANDLQVYKEVEKEEGRLMIIFLVNPEEKVMYCTTIEKIEKNIAWKSKDNKDGKLLIWFKPIQKIAEVPQSIVNQINKIKNEQ